MINTQVNWCAVIGWVGELADPVTFRVISAENQILRNVSLPLYYSKNVLGDFKDTFDSQTGITSNFYKKRQNFTHFQHSLSTLTQSLLY